MKKLLLILLPISIFLVSCGGGGSDDLQPIDPPTLTLEETLVGKKWCLSNEDEDGFILSPGGGFFTTKKCTPHDWEGSWFFEGNLIKYSYTQNSIQTTVLWGKVTEYSATEVKILEDSTSNLIIEKVYSIKPEDILGCTDETHPNFNPSANCDDGSCHTFVPDDGFEEHLIFWGFDDIMDNYVQTQAIDTITEIRFNYNAYFTSISDFTGIEDFKSLEYLQIYPGQEGGTPVDIDLKLTNNPSLKTLIFAYDWWNNDWNPFFFNLDLSGATSLEYLEVYSMDKNFGADLTNNTNLRHLQLTYCGLTNLDLTNNNELRHINVYGNQLTNLDLSNNNNLLRLNCDNNLIYNIDLSQNLSLNTVYIRNNQLTSINIKNGNNTNFLYFKINGNPNLNCINVDDSVYSASNWTDIDPQHYFSEDCP